MATVTELIKQLTQLPGEMQVIMSKDGEGNGFSPFADISTGLYEADSTWSGEMQSYEYTDDGEEVEIPEDRHNAIVLWPTN